MKGDQTTLSIKHIPSGQNILRLPLTQYLLLSKIYNDIGEMSDQEYLDRQDSYTLLFFNPAIRYRNSAYMPKNAS